MLSLAAAPASAQSTPDAGSLLRQQEELERQVPQRIPEAEKPEVVKPAMRKVEEILVRVKEIRFSGAVDLVPEARLRSVVEDAIGQELGFAGLQALANKVTAYLREQGYLLARAYLPRQDVTEGVIEIAILEGRLDGAADEGGGWEIRREESARINPGRLEAMAEAAAPSGSAARKRELERALLLMNELPGVSARARLAPGMRTGTTRVVVDVNEGPLVSGNAWADNYGNTSTGEYRVNAWADLNNPGGWGDQGNLIATGSEGVRLIRAGYSLPLGHAGLRARLGYTAMAYEVKKGDGKAIGLEGDSRTANAGLSYPFIRSRAFSLYGSLDYHRKALTDDSNVGMLRDKRLDVGTAALSGDALDRLGGGGLSRFRLAWTKGDLDLSRIPADEAADAATLKTKGNYDKLHLEVSRLQRLPGPFTLLGQFSAQRATKNLDSSEAFIVGGPIGVRAYPVGEGQGDEGWLAAVELRYDHPGVTPLGDLRLSAFSDTGRIRLHEDPGQVAITTATGKNSYQLSGAGLGLELASPGSYRLRVSWAHTIGNNDGRTPDGNNADGDDGHSRFWLQAIVWF